jgi:hypothetical protein
MILDLLQKTFSGIYKFHRTVSFPTITYEGISCFSLLSDSHMRYREEGNYKLGNALQYAYQERYFQLYRDYFVLLKSDGSILHRFNYSPPEEKTKNVSLKFFHTHSCKNDFYNCVFSIGENNFSTYYKITGPFKDYTIETKYIRE